MRADMRQSDDDPDQRRGPVRTNPSVRRLTDREHETALLIADGLKNAAIARRLDLSPKTVDNYVQHIRQRLNLASRGEITAWVTAQRAPDSPDGRLRRVDGER